jgi:hypothetical protein
VCGYCREFLPNQIVDAFAGIEVAKFLKKSREGGLVGGMLAVVDFLRASNVEGNPQECRPRRWPARRDSVSSRRGGYAERQAGRMFRRAPPMALCLSA